MANLKDLIVNGASRFIGKVFINNSTIGVINNSTVGDYPKFTDTTYAAVGTSGNPGLMSTADKVKLDTIATSATRNTWSAFTGAPTGNQTPSFGGTFNIYQVGQTTAGAITTTTRTVTIPNTAATTAAPGLMSTYDKKILAGLTTSIGRAGKYYGGTAESAMPIYFNATNGFKELDGNYVFVEKVYDGSTDGTDFDLFRAGSILWFNSADTTSSLSNSPGAYHGFCITLGSHSGYDTASRISQFFVIYDNTDSLNTIFYRSKNTGWSSWLNIVPQIQTTTWSKPTISSSNITITSGGYYKEGKHVYVQMQGATAKTLTANTVTTVATGLPSVSGAPLAVLSITIGNKSDGYTAQVTTGGALRFRATASVASGQTYNITGVYTMA